jgi:acyl-CoA synthetase (AMP-forming)/AMP-acid ligase II
MHGLIQYRPLLLSGFLEHAAETYPEVSIASWSGNRLFRYTYADAAARARRLASSLQRRGFGPGDFIGSLAWTTHRHFELMYAAPGIGVVLHTANPRLSPEHLSYTLNHSEARILFVDPECLAQIEDLAPQLRSVESFVVMGDGSDLPATRLPNVLFYEDLLAEGDETFAWPNIDERSGSTLCFTSGTTGDPKGILYSHRGTYLSTLAIAAANVWAISESDTIIIVAPFFHCNGWGAPYLGPMAGAKLVLPGRALDARSLQRLIVEEGATVGPAVPTVWHAIAEHCRQAGEGLGKLNRIICGGAAPPLALMRTYWREFGIRTVQVWGMTETTHAASVLWTDEDVLSGRAEPRTPQGRPVFGTELRIVDDEGGNLPHDGKTVGHLQVRGHACATGYLRRPDVEVLDRDGWLKTGDLAAIEAGSGLRITDRLKDVIKSGGEWISSIDLENAASSHSAVAEAAVIGVPHPHWQERPVMFVVLRTGHELSAEVLRAHLAPTVAKWWLPDEVLFVNELPHYATGKVRKDVLRTQYAAGASAKKVPST